MCFACPYLLQFVQTVYPPHFPTCLWYQTGMSIIASLVCHSCRTSSSGLPTVRGIQRGGIENKNFLYVNDMLLYVSDPITSLPKILKMLTEFGVISGYKVNLNKSELMSVSYTPQLQKVLFSNFHLKLV